MVEWSDLEKLGFSLDGWNPNRQALRFYGQPVGNYDRDNGGRVELFENCPANGLPGGDYIASVEYYIKALEVLTREKIPFTGPDLDITISILHGTRAAINGFEDRIQSLRAKREPV